MVRFTWRCFHDVSLGAKDRLRNLMVALPGLSYDYFIVTKTPILPATASLIIHNTTEADNCCISWSIWI